MGSNGPSWSALAGALAAASIETAIVVGAGACLVAGVTAALMIPRHAPTLSGAAAARAARPAGVATDPADWP
jgi:hypothetical protein